MSLMLVLIFTVAIYTYMFEVRYILSVSEFF